MNFKPNLWTLLFAITLAILLYQNLGSESPVNPPPAVDSCCTPPPSSPGRLDPTVAQSRIESYSDKYIAELQLKCPNLATEIGLVSPFVSSFKIPRADLLDAYCTLQNGTVYAQMALIADVTGNNRDTIDIIFSDEEPGYQGPGNYFDFTTPCPPLCPN